MIGYSEEMQRRNRELKDFLYKNLYRHYRVVRMQVKAERIISESVQCLSLRAAHAARSCPEIIDKRGLERTICDYIAGMTDRYAIEEHERLTNPSLNLTHARKTTYLLNR